MMASVLPTKAIRIKCRNCGGEASSEDFRLDNLKGIMVCPNCDKKDRSASMTTLRMPTNRGNEPTLQSLSSPKTAPQKTYDKIEKKTDPGWDETDEFLEKAYRQKVTVQDVKFEKIQGERYTVVYECGRCAYKFRYNSLKHWPNKCPSCAKEVKMLGPYL